MRVVRCYLSGVKARVCVERIGGHDRRALGTLAGSSARNHSDCTGSCEQPNKCKSRGPSGPAALVDLAAHPPWLVATRAELLRRVRWVCEARRVSDVPPLARGRVHRSQGTSPDA